MNAGDMSLADSREVGRVLRKARKESGRQLQDTATAAGISTTRLRQLEAGHVTRPGGAPKPTSLTRQKLIALCKVLKISPDRADEILKLSRYAPLEETEREQLEPTPGRGVIYLDEFSPEQQERLRSVVQRLREENRK